MRNGINSKKRRKMNPPTEAPLSPASTAPPPPTLTAPPPPTFTASPTPATITSPQLVAMDEVTLLHSPSEISPPPPVANSPPRPSSNEEQLNPPWLPHDNDEDTQPIALEFYLEQTNYTKFCKLSSRSEENKTIAKLD
ncbi:PREDICTED: classical arabinogalactan protein 9-like [Camelina sativa]|uniref:Classical arabinogalactan protein 9-like n=1 Tax=Camelina sativa TaxID=90675 RepID=A0ABM1QUB4_CAMSA|nr:PREDICTED: classical arabinogalactan protein 9-like [Camelina sativa]